MVPGTPQEPCHLPGGGAALHTSVRGGCPERGRLNMRAQQEALGEQGLVETVVTGLVLNWKLHQG